MSVLIQVKDGSKNFGSRQIFDRASFAVQAGEHIGLIGPNGAGKSTLLKILAQVDQLDSGEVIKSRELRLGYLAQQETSASEELVESFLETHSRLPIWDLKALGIGLGLKEEQFSLPMNQLSGGFQMRVRLLALLGQECNLLLLDEPTNYLDLESLLVLEKFLLNYQGAFLLVSHDREFLRRTTDHILEVEAGQFTKFNGNIDDYFEQKAIWMEQAQKKAMNQAAQRQEILSFAAKFGAKATKAKQVQSRLKRLDKFENIEARPIPIRANIQIPAPLRTGKEVLTVEEAEMGYEPGHPVIENVNMNLYRGDHLGVVGINGAGKSTLLKTLAQRLKPLSGRVKAGHQVKVGYYAQHVAQELDPSETVFQALQRAAHPDILPQEVRDLAGSLLFREDDIEKKTKILSGGEKARIALGQVLLGKSPCLLLDEPTNHLDFETVEALTQALHKYEGTVVVVSHDRGFIQRIASKILEIRNGRAEVYPGSYDEYVWSLQKGAWGSKDTPSGESNSDRPSNQSSAKNNKINYKEQKKSLQKAVTQFKKQIAQADKELETLRSHLNESQKQLMSAKGPEAETLAKDLSQIKNKIDTAEENWIELNMNLEEAEAQLSELIQ